MQRLACLIQKLLFTLIFIVSDMFKPNKSVLNGSEHAHSKVSDNFVKHFVGFPLNLQANLFLREPWFGGY